MNDKNILVRNFHLNDTSSLTELTNELGYDTTVEQMNLRMKTIMQLENYWTFVALINEKVVGYIGLNKNYFWEKDGHYLKIQALVVNHQFRQLGVGQKLIDKAEELAIQTNSKSILLNCGNRDERKMAHKFYIKVGFEPKSTGYIKKLKNIDKI